METTLVFALGGLFGGFRRLDQFRARLGLGGRFGGLAPPRPAPGPARRGRRGLARGSAMRGSSLKPNGTEGSLKPVMASNGTVSRSGLREKLRLTSK